MKVIPVVNCHYKDFKCVTTKARIAEKFSKWVHLDVADARFTFNKSWDEAEKWPEFKTKLNLEVHLMVEEPEKVAESWLKTGAKRLIVHIETINEKTFGEILNISKRYDAQVMLASNPDAPAENLKPYFKKTSEFQVLAVHPGSAGQEFLPQVLPKIKFLRQELPDATIEVDGGINPETTKLVKDAGADAVVSGTYIFNNPQPETAFKELENI